jgi:predicted peroxiredoxin
MASGKVVVNLSTGAQDPEQVTVAFLVADSAVSAGNELVMFLTREAVRLALDGEAAKVTAPGYRPVGELFDAVAAGGGELHCCPPCFKTRSLDEARLVRNAKVSGAMALFQWMGPGGATVFSF